MVAILFIYLLLSFQRQPRLGSQVVSLRRLPSTGLAFDGPAFRGLGAKDFSKATWIDVRRSDTRERRNQRLLSRAGSLLSFVFTWSGLSHFLGISWFVVSHGPESSFLHAVGLSLFFSL